MTSILCVPDSIRFDLIVFALTSNTFSLAQYMVMKEQSSLPQSALNMIRYHSFYPWHREGAYKYFENEKDEQALKDVLVSAKCILLRFHYSRS